MKTIRHFFCLHWFLLAATLVACDSATAPVDSIATAPYYQNQALLERAWRLPVAQTYKNGFEYQDNWAFCGPATVVNLFRSLKIERFTQDSLFDRATVGYWKARFLGLTLDELAALVRDNAGLEVAVIRDVSLEGFRELMRGANDPRFRYLINFDRRPLFGVRVGHHSPVGGYLRDSDLVFVLDVLADYRPFLVPVDRLYEAMDTVDSETGKKRGLLRVGATDAGATAPRAP